TTGLGRCARAADVRRRRPPAPRGADALAMAAMGFRSPARRAGNVAAMATTNRPAARIIRSTPIEKLGVYDRPNACELFASRGWLTIVPSGMPSMHAAR